MPGMNGLETLDKLREKSLSGRVVVFSVSNHEEDVVTALKRGADGYLLKDMEPEDLLKALQQAAAGEMVLSEALTPCAWPPACARTAPPLTATSAS